MFSKSSIVSFHPTQMIEPKTEAGKQLHSHYLQKIKTIEEDDRGYDKSGPGSKNTLMNDLRKEYNSELCKIETVSAKELTEASRPQMNEPKTQSGIELKQKYDAKITEAQGGNGETAYINEKVNNLRKEYNELLEKIEG